MLISPHHLEHLWYEDEDGNVVQLPDFVSNLTGDELYTYLSENTIAKYSCQLNPLIVKSTCFEVVKEYEVKACDHPSNMVLRYIDGSGDDFDARQCVKCGGVQVRHISEDKWPEEWHARGYFRKDEDVEYIKPEDEDLIIKLMDFLKKPGNPKRRRYLSDAITIVYRACGRCRNVIRHDLGLGGYPEYSKEWCDSEERCDLCIRLKEVRYDSGKTNESELLPGDSSPSVTEEHLQED